MKALLLDKIAPLKDNPNPLRIAEVPAPEIGDNDILIKIFTCGICHTELDEIEGRTPPPTLPIILGHQIVGKVVKKGANVKSHKVGDRVGVAWIYSSCGKCYYCKNGYENLCSEFKATGRDANGGYAEYIAINEKFAYPIPEIFSNVEAAPLLCAGVIGYRALRLAKPENGMNIGLFGFGASAHILIQVINYLYPDSKVFVFTRPGQTVHQNLAKKLGAYWVGATGEIPPKKLHCAIDFTPAWKPIVHGMRVLERGGRLVINAIRKENFDKNSLLELDYARDLWLEKEFKSVANVTRQDAIEFLPIAAKIPIKPETQIFTFDNINHALNLLKQGKIKGAGVLVVSD